MRLKGSRPALAAIIAFVLFVGGAAGSHDNPSLLAPTNQCRVGASSEMLCLHNYARGKLFMQPLYRHTDLVIAARAKLQRILECDQFSHRPCGDAFVCPQGGPWNSCSENLAMGYMIRGSFNAWLHSSSGHREAILYPSARYYGAAFDPFLRLWVVVFTW